jgi:glycosyltransferase involved in cell wall biosynthesis
MMRVLHLLGATEDSGGILTVLRNLQAVTADQGYEHRVLVHRKYQEVRKPPLSYFISNHLVQDSPRHLALAWGAIRALPELRVVLRRERFDVLHAHTRGSFVMAQFLTTLGRRRMVFTNHGFARRRGLYRWGARRRRLITCVLTPNMARHYGLSLSEPNVRVVSECCADQFFAQPLGERRPLEPGERLRLVGLGNLVEWKKWHVLLEALGRLPAEERGRLEFHHWGTAPNTPDCQLYERQLQALVARHQLETTCVFHGLSLAVEETLRTASWFVLPSLNEPCSVALIEALAMGLPALVTASGGNVDVVRGEETGLFFEPDDVAGLARCLGRIARGETSMAPAAQIRESVRRRSATAVARDYVAIYCSLCR